MAAGDPGRLFEDTDVVVCCGSGGVGKTTIAAVIGLEGAGRGRRAVVVTIDPARRLADALGLPDGLGAEPRRIDVEGPGEMWAMMLDTERTFDALVRRHAADDEQAERILSNAFYRNMAHSLSGTQEYMAAETLHQLHGDDRFDLVIVDTPPSRNALDFLEAPGVLARFLDHKLFKLMMLPARRSLRVVNAASQPVLRAIGRIVGSDVLADAVAFFQAFAGMESGFRQRAQDVIQIVRSDRTRYVVVASPHRETVAEAVWFAEQLREQGVEAVDGIVNRIHPHFGKASPKDAATRAEKAEADGDDDRAALWRNVAELRLLAGSERTELAPFAEALGGPPVGEVPLLGGDVHDLAALTEVRAHLFP